MTRNFVFCVLGSTLYVPRPILMCSLLRFYAIRKINPLKNNTMSDDRTEYNEYSNNIIHKNGQSPGFFGWIWIIMQGLLVLGVSILYLIFEFLFNSINYFSSNITYFTKELWAHKFVTLAKYCVFIILVYFLLNIFKNYFPVIDPDLWIIIITVVAPFVVRFYIFDMCLFRTKKISDIEKE